MQGLAEWYEINVSTWMPKQVFVALVSMLPLIELRGGIVVARLLNMPLWEGNLWSIVGNIIPIPFILLFLKRIFTFLKERRILVRFVEWLERKAEKKSKGMDRGFFTFLLLFVGIPIPGTGAWTGSLISSVYELDIKKASLAIFLGLLMATVIMDVLAYFVPGLFGFTVASQPVLPELFRAFGVPV
ncbi:MAG: small multi-drug export protein [Lachnospiraceae bacterium]|nr:small multi-drug export protein [Lachnospiraceae bacterium]